LKLVQACIAEAKRLRLPKVVFWNPAEWLRSLVGGPAGQLLSGKIEAREDAIPSVQVFWSNVYKAAGEVGKPPAPETVRWLANEKYLWV
jgi:hypothetical protein